MPNNGSTVYRNFHRSFHTLVTIAGLHPAAGGSRDS